MPGFPFPDRIVSRRELISDVLYERIPEEERLRICDAAWNMGVRTAENLLKEDPDLPIYELAERYDLQLVREKRDKVSAGLRFFSEYVPKENRVYLYECSIHLFAEHNAMLYGEAEELIVAHEFYHFMENKIIGKTSDLYQVPVLSLGPIKIGKSGVQALCEIGAHGFARTYWEHRYETTNCRGIE